MSFEVDFCLSRVLHLPKEVNMKKMLYILIATLLLSVFPAFAVDEAGDEGPSFSQTRLMELGFQVFKEAVEAPEIELEDTNGQLVSLSSHRGKVVILNFWATWCPPCRAEMPSMQRLYEELNDDGIELLAVDLQESEKTVKDFLEKNGYTFPVLFDRTGQAGAMYGARSIPTTYLIDADGMAVARVVGTREWDDEELYEVLLSMVPGN